MSSSDDKAGGPVMQLLASGLQLWVRQQCQAIGSLDIQLQGTGLQLLRGRLAGVQLLARRVVYKDLHFELVELSSGPIQVHSGNLLKGQPLQLERAFEIQGQVSFTADGLTRSLSAPQWRALGDGLGEACLASCPWWSCACAATTWCLPPGPSALPTWSSWPPPCWQLGAASKSAPLTATSAAGCRWIPASKSMMPA